jgi:L-aminopeptidase/D-esterase-like protein
MTFDLGIPGQTNSIADISGLRVGQATDWDAKTGVSVVLCDEPMTAGISTLGGAPGTRDTDLLRQGNSVEKVNGIALSGGSAFGLDAAGGVMAALAEQNIGYEVKGSVVPIVPSAILFDLASGGKKWEQRYPPHRELGYEAVLAADRNVSLGSIGAGTGAIAGWLKGGIGSASSTMPNGVTVAALIAVNSLGQTTIGDHANFWAAPFEMSSEFGGLGPARNHHGADNMRLKFFDELAEKQNTTIGIVATDADLTPSQCERLAVSGQDGLARAIWPCHTPLDGDCIFSLSNGEREIDERSFFLLCAAASAVCARAVARGVYEANALQNDPYPSWQQKFGKNFGGS